MHTIRTRLILAFLVATILPLTSTVWVTTTLLDRSLSYATTGELDHLSRTLEATVRQFYQREREALKQDALEGHETPAIYRAASTGGWPESVRAFWDSGEAERFAVVGVNGDRLEYLRRRSADAHGPAGVDAYSRDLHGVRMEELTAEFRRTRELVGSLDARDLRRGFTLTLLLLLALVWLVSLAPLVLIAHRISRPIQQLTAGLNDFAAGDWSRRIDAPAGSDEVGRAVGAFNHMADQLRQSRARLVHLTRMASWQSLARKTAHELKNSLTPIRLTVEEMVARQPPADRAFMQQAAQIVVSEIDTLERRVRAFSEFASEPPVTPEVIDLNALVGERVALLRPTHPGIVCDLRLDPRAPRVRAGADQVKGILTNLLQNAADAVGEKGAILVVTRAAADDAAVVVEIDDSGPGLSPEAAATLFEPTITFKKDGMGLGLSIAKNNALLSGGDVTRIESRMGGAAFRVTLPPAILDS